ncbi:molybdopterin-binding protein [Planktotalea arctica]|uniref:molybdopterin-binding protein n=1 Tax=Planktotalea arctica TaxID=1481893 RepID=UPI003219E30F
MKFGPIPLEAALGSILAHSVSLEAGRLRKGVILEQHHINQLKKAGLNEVTAATLEQGDVEENEAARRLGAALLAGTTGLYATQAATGRVNLIADGPGLALLDVARATALNAVNPMISFASVPAHHQMHAKGMLGTVKIISYAVHEDDLAAACAHARGALRLAVPRHNTVTLIVTQINENTDESKAIKATGARLAALESPLIETLICAHNTDALTQSIRAARGEVILILTGSATSDPHDVAPMALMLAGGTLTRFGMPVDPGNLLFLGALAGRSVIGLPGCARSPALNGADKVLSRVLCGVDVTSADIAGMGVGGLLKEIPTRPRPRSA